MLRLAVDPMPLGEAIALTERIRMTADDLWALAVEAYRGRAWEPLGYSTWRVYAEAEFGRSRSHVYRLLAQGEVTLELEAAARIDRRDGDPPLVSSRVAQALRGNLADLASRVRLETKGLRRPARARIVRTIVEDAVDYTVGRSSVRPGRDGLRPGFIIREYRGVLFDAGDVAWRCTHHHKTRREAVDCSAGELGRRNQEKTA